MTMINTYEIKWNNDVFILFIDNRLLSHVDDVDL